MLVPCLTECKNTFNDTLIFLFSVSWNLHFYAVVQTELYPWVKNFKKYRCCIAVSRGGGGGVKTNSGEATSLGQTSTGLMNF